MNPRGAGALGHIAVEVGTLRRACKEHHRLLRVGKVMNDGDLNTELERAEEAYEDLVRTRASLGTALAEAIKRSRDLTEFDQLAKDLPYLMQKADARRTELRIELLSRRLKGAEAAHARAAEDARRTLAALEAAKRAHVKAAGVERRRGLEAQQLRDLRDQEAARLERLRGEKSMPEETSGS
jgi:hypothetical protein